MGIKKKGYIFIIVLICITMVVPAIGITAGMAQGGQSNNSRSLHRSENKSKAVVQKDEYAVKGYSKEEVTEAKMLAERVLYQLQEITGQAGDTLEDPKEDIQENGIQKNSIQENDMQKENIPKDDTRKDNMQQGDMKSDDIIQYRELQGKIDEKTAINLMVKLKKDFNGFEGVLDEYLYCLQIGIKFDLYLTDRKEYKKERTEKSTGIDTSRIITISKIEDKMLEVVQKRNKNKIDEVQKDMKKTDLKVAEAVGQGNKVESPVPDVDKIKPENPAEDINKEISNIKDRSFGIEQENNGSNQENSEKSGNGSNIGSASESSQESNGGNKVNEGK